jgi:hypothetical protein
MSKTATFSVMIKVVREHSATIKVRAASQAEADELALAMYWERGDGPLGLSAPWVEHEPRDSDPEIDTWDRCVDCRENAGYYMVSDELWAASGLKPHDGMLCLSCLEQRIGQPLTLDDFTAIVPSQEAWERHVAQRDRRG